MSDRWWKELTNETTNCCVRDEMKVMRTDDQLTGERKPEVYCWKRIKHNGTIGYLFWIYQSDMIRTVDVCKAITASKFNWHYTRTTCLVRQESLDTVSTNTHRQKNRKQITSAGPMHLVQCGLQWKSWRTQCQHLRSPAWQIYTVLC